MSLSCLSRRSRPQAAARLLALFFFSLLAPLALAQTAQPTPTAPANRPTPASPVSPATITQTTSATQAVPLYQGVPDSAERMNRSFFAFNEVVMDILIKPLAHGFRFIFPRPVRKSFSKFEYNLAYPLHLLNTLFQGKFKGAGVETGRFLLNTTVGLAGFFDPASRLGWPKYDEDFGQTFAHYGAGTGSYLVLPMRPPSNVRDTLAWPLDTVANPGSWVPGLGFFFLVNQTSFLLPQLWELEQTERDPYAVTRLLTSLKRQQQVRDYNPSPRKTEPVPTLEAILLRVQDRRFPGRAKQRKVSITETGRKLPYSLWLQKQPAPLVCVLPGIGMHRLAGSTVAIAELAWQRGCSVVTLSSAMSWEFMERAGTNAVPGYTPQDARDVSRAIGLILADLNRKYPGRVTSTAMVGLSLGALHTLFAAAQEGQEAPALDRYIAINPPADQLYALEQIDAYYAAALEWPAAERQANMEKALIKVLMFAQAPPQATPGPLPFDDIESRYLIGLNYRLILREILCVSNAQSPTPLLRHSCHGLRREPAYQEAASYSYADFFRRFVLPYYTRQTGLAPARLVHDSNLWSIREPLRANPRVRVFLNTNDFILRDSDVGELKALLGERVTVFSGGGHLGNLYRPDIQRQIMAPLAELNRQAPAAPPARPSGASAAD